MYTQSNTLMISWSVVIMTASCQVFQNTIYMKPFITSNYYSIICVHV